MGNYNGTVRCGHCYTSGHNSRTCPPKRERMQKPYETAKAAASPIAKRVVITGASAERWRQIEFVTLR